MDWRDDFCALLSSAGNSGFIAAIAFAVMGVGLWPFFQLGRGFGAGDSADGRFLVDAIWRGSCDLAVARDGWIGNRDDADFRAYPVCRIPADPPCCSGAELAGWREGGRHDQEIGLAQYCAGRSDGGRGGVIAGDLI